MKNTASASGNPSSPLRMTHRLNHTASASGKIILSGEYAVVFGYPGIGVPAPFAVTATWTNGPSPSLAPARFTLSRGEREKKIHGMTVRHRGIENEDYLHRILDAIIAITGPLHGHLTIENTIPIGRGMGSSTALVIAICRCFIGCKKNPPLPSGEGWGEGDIKKIALSIEDIVNPGHSGLDFEVIWNKTPLLFQKGKPPKCTDVPVHQYTCMSTLIDTGKPNEMTQEMVEWVKERIGIPSPSGGGLGRGGKKGWGISALQTIAHCTERLLVGESPFTVFPDHHRAQVALGVVPKSVQTLIADIEESGGAAKVVGAGGRTGGGGMVLAIHQNKNIVEQLAKEHSFPTLSP